MFKALFGKVCPDKSLIAESGISTALPELASVKTSNCRRGGFYPQRWTTGGQVRVPGSIMDEGERDDFGVLQVMATDESGSFAGAMAIRAAAHVQFDGSARPARALIRISAPLPGRFELGDLVSYRRWPRKCDHGMQWSAAARIIGRVVMEFAC